MKEHLCNVRRGVFKTGERPPLQTRQSKATFVLPWTTHTKKGGPENGPKKWPALALHTRPGDRKRTPFSKMPLHFFVFVSERAPKSPSSFAIAAWQCHYFWEARAPPGRTSGHAAHEEHDVCMNMIKAPTHSAPSLLPAHPRCRCSARCERVLHGMYARALNDNMPRKEHMSRHHRKCMQTKKRERWSCDTRD